MAGRVVLRQRIENQRRLWSVHDLNHFDRRRTNRFSRILSDFPARFDDNFTSPIAAGRVDNVIHRDFAIEFCNAAAVKDFNLHRVVERTQDVRVFAVLGVHRTQQCQSRELTALVDSNCQRVFLGDVNFNPTSAFGNHAARRHFAIGRCVRLQNKVDTRTAVQLTDNNALGTVDDKLTTTHHDRNVTEVDFLFNRLLFVQA